MAKFKNHLLIFLRGLAMGAADAIPGVSGGTIAFISGIYDRLINSISDINTLLVKELIHLKFRPAYKNLKKIDYALFVPLILGIILAIYTFSHVLGFFFTKLKAETFAFFFGLVLASALFIYNKLDKKYWRIILFTIIGFAIGFWVTGFEHLQANHTPIILILSGAIAICAMILPGISGAFILLLLGQYEYVLAAVKNLYLETIALVAIGAVIGLLSFSKLLSYLLKRFKSQTLSFLGGLMLGTLRLLYREMTVETPNILFLIIAALIGVALVLAIVSIARKKKSS